MVRGSEAPTLSCPARLPSLADTSGRAMEAEAGRKKPTLCKNMPKQSAMAASPCGVIVQAPWCAPLLCGASTD